MNILITSVGRRSYLVNYFKEALVGKGKVHVMNSSNISPAFNVADYAVVSPLIYSDNYISFLVDYCKKNDIKVLLSLFDIDLLVLSKNKEKFDEIGVKLICSDYGFIDICNDKWKTYNFLNDNGFNTPKTYLGKNHFLADVKSKKINYPVIIKPRWGMGSLSIYEADNEEELNVLYEKTMNGIKNSYLKYEAMQDLEHSIIIQEMIKGQEYGLDIINDLDGNYKSTIVRKKYAMRSGETDCAEIINNKNMKKLGQKLSKVTKHIANLDIDLFEYNDRIYILEMNARFSGGYPFSHIAGVNLPLAIVKWCNNEDVPQTILEAKFGILAHKDIGIVKLDKGEK